MCSLSECMLSFFSCVRLYATLWTIAHKAPLSMGFSRQEDWNGLLFPSPGYLPDLEIEPTSLKSLALAGGSLPLAPPGKPVASWNLLYDSENSNQGSVTT